MKYSELKKATRLWIYAMRRENDWCRINENDYDCISIDKRDFTQSEWDKIIAVIGESIVRVRAEAEEAVSALGLDMDEKLDEYY